MTLSNYGFRDAAVRCIAAVAAALLLCPAAASARQPGEANQADAPGVSPGGGTHAASAGRATPLRFAVDGFAGTGGPWRVPAPIAGRAAPSGGTAAQERAGRYTRRGSVIGGVTGAAVGLGMGAFIALFCASEGDGCLAAIPAVTLFGAASGAVGGAIIGAAIPRPVAEGAPRAGTTPAAPTSRGRWLGSASLAAGWADALIADESGLEPFNSGGVGARASLAAEHGNHIALGPEVGHANFGGAGDIRYAALAVRATLATGEVRPYVTANLGAYQTTGPSLEFLGGGAGAGLRVTPFGRQNLFVDAEGRWSRHMQNIAPMRMRGVSLALGWRW